MKLSGFFFASALLLSATVTNAQSLRDYANKATDAVSGNNASGSLSNDDITAGLRDALQVGIKNASGKLGAADGYFGNQLIKIVMPSDAKKIETVLRQAGMGDQVDRAILSMNRAAEDAAPKAVDIFFNAIKSMSIQDGLSILRGSDDAATQYLKSKTSAALTAAFRPVIKESLDKVNATKYWADMINTYNSLPTTFHKMNPDLTAYVTERALNGLFITVAQEEAKIRKDPTARVTDMLKKVFGSH